MRLEQVLNRVKNCFSPTPRYNAETQLWETKRFGHTKTYDFEGFLVSDAFQDKGTTIVDTFVPGTKKNAVKKQVLHRQEYTKNGILTDEVWYNAEGKMAAYYSDMDPNAILLLKNGTPDRATTREAFDAEVMPLIHLIKNRTFIVNFNLNELTQKIQDRLDHIVQTAPAYHRGNKQDQTTAEPIPANTQVKSIGEVLSIQPETPVVEAQPQQKKVEPKPKLTPEQKRARWEERLAKRQEKHDKLLAMKAKVEASKHMNPTKKAERLASLNERLMHNERAQHLLNTRLAALSAAQKRDEWKQIKASRQSAYHDLQAKLKQKRQEFKLTKSEMTKEELVICRQDLKKSAEEKNQALSDYRAAIKATKLASVKTRKLKSTKRQKTIFDLALVVREKDALERALFAETNLFNMGIMSDKLDALLLKKRILLNKYKEMTKPRKVELPQVANMKLTRHPLLPNFTQTP